MVNTSSNSKKENNRVIISNNKAKYYSDLAQTYANQSKNYSDIAKTAQEAVNSIVDADDLSTIADNIEDIQEIAENLESLTAATVWGDIGGTLSSQVDLKEALDAKADTEDLSEVATSGSYNDLTDKPTIPDISNLATKTEVQAKADTADLSEVATSGSYNDLTDKPTIPDISNLATKTEVQAKADTADLSDVATSGSYNDLTDKPTIPSQYTLPTASTTTLGGVKVDGSTITVSSDGTISSIGGSGGSGSSITVDSELSDSSTNPVQNKIVTAALTEVTTLAYGTSSTLTQLTQELQAVAPIIQEIANGGVKHNKGLITLDMTGTATDFNVDYSHTYICAPNDNTTRNIIIENIAGSDTDDVYDKYGYPAEIFIQMVTADNSVPTLNFYVGSVSEGNKITQFFNGALPTIEGGKIYDIIIEFTPLLNQPSVGIIYAGDYNNISQSGGDGAGGGGWY